MLNEIFNWLFPEKIQAQQQAKEIVIKIENRVRQLSNLPVNPYLAQDLPNGLLARLNHIDLLTERLLENREINEPSEDIKDIIAVRSTTEKPAEEIEAKIVNNEPTISTFPTPAKTILEPTLSKTAKELIDLRDWVLLAKTGSNASSPEVLEILYQRLGKILEQEDVTTLEEYDQFNYERQQIISTKVTDDPEKNDTIAETIRPGYIFNDSIIRPQEVILYSVPK
jgi:GrpE